MGDGLRSSDGEIGVTMGIFLRIQSPKAGECKRPGSPC